MSVNTCNITLSDWLEAESALKNGKPRPPGWITAIEYSNARGITLVHAQHRLKEMWERGLVERMRWMTDGKSFFLYRLPASKRSSSKNAKKKRL